LKKKLQEVLTKEEYEIEDTFDDNVDKVLASNAFQLEGGYAKYLSPGERTAKNIKQSNQYDKFDFGKKIIAAIKAVNTI
jgi:hypothetical protein